MMQIVQKEAKRYKLTIRNRLTRVLEDVSAATLNFYLRATRDGSNLVTITNAEMDMTEAADGYVYITLTPSHTDRAGYFYGLLHTLFTTLDVDETFFDFYIEAA